MKRLKVGVIGLGVGERHVAAYKSHPQAEVVATCDFDKNKEATTRRAQDVIENPKIDVVSIASYDADHARQVIAALKAGKHVFVEKPLCKTEAELEAIREEFGKHPELKLSARFPLRLVPRFLEVKRRYEAGELGKLFYVEGDYNYGRLEKLVEGWRAKEDGYSVFLGGAVHVVDYLMWLTGDEVVEVKAFGNNLVTRGSAFENNDLTVALLRFKSGMLAKISANFGCVYPHFHRLSLYGAKGTFENGLEHGWLFRGRDGASGPESVPQAYPGDKGRPDHIHGFVDAILHGSDPPVTAQEIFTAMEVCLAVEQESVYSKVHDHSIS